MNYKLFLLVLLESTLRTTLINYFCWFIIKLFLQQFHNILIIVAVADISILKAWNIIYYFKYFIGFFFTIFIWAKLLYFFQSIKNFTQCLRFIWAKFLKILIFWNRCFNIIIFIFFGKILAYHCNKRQWISLPTSHKLLFNI